MPDTHPPSPADESLNALASSLDGLGNALAARESSEPPAALTAAMLIASQRRRAVRTLAFSGLAAALLLAVLAFAMMRPARTPETLSPPVVRTTTPTMSEPTMATLRTLNRNSTPETLHLPSTPSGAASAAGASISPRDALDPESVARVLGSLK